MARLIHLNGPPGIGKSTLARQYVEQAHGTLNCDVDLLRTMIGGWADDFLRTGHLIRPGALGLIRGYLEHSGDVVLPQMLYNPREVDRFAAAASAAGAAYVEIMLLADPDEAVGRFHRRGAAYDEDPWHREVHRFVDAQGGDELLRRNHEQLLELLELRPQIAVVQALPERYDETLADVRRVVRDWPEVSA